MCEICQEICDKIRDLFGHVVDSEDLEMLIEKSPLEHPYEHGKHDEHLRSVMERIRTDHGLIEQEAINVIENKTRARD